MRTSLATVDSPPQSRKFIDYNEKQRNVLKRVVNFNRECDLYNMYSTYTLDDFIKQRKMYDNLCDVRTSLKQAIKNAKFPSKKNAFCSQTNT